MGSWVITVVAENLVDVDSLSSLNCVALLGKIFKVIFLCLLPSFERELLAQVTWMVFALGRTRTMFDFMFCNNSLRRSKEHFENLKQAII